MIEKYIPGREIQVAILGKKKLGAIELKPKRKFYDYQAKYNANAKTKHIIPIEINKKYCFQCNDSSYILNPCDSIFFSNKVIIF